MDMTREINRRLNSNGEYVIVHQETDTEQVLDKNKTKLQDVLDDTLNYTDASGNIQATLADTDSICVITTATGKVGKISWSTLQTLITNDPAYRQIVYSDTQPTTQEENDYWAQTTEVVSDYQRNVNLEGIEIGPAPFPSVTVIGLDSQIAQFVKDTDVDGLSDNGLIIRDMLKDHKYLDLRLSEAYANTDLTGAIRLYNSKTGTTYRLYGEHNKPTVTDVITSPIEPGLGGTGKSSIMESALAFRRTVLVGNDAEENIGWFPVGTWTLSNTNTSVKTTLVMTGNMTSFGTGILEICLRTTITGTDFDKVLSNFVWTSTNGAVDPSDFALVNDTGTGLVTLYQYIAEGNESYTWSILDESISDAGTSIINIDPIVTLTSNFGNTPIFLSDITAKMTSTCASLVVQGNKTITKNYVPNNNFLPGFILNHQGNTTYYGGGGVYTIDGWRQWFTGSTTITSNGLTLTNEGENEDAIMYYLEMRSGLTYTLSVMIDGQIYSSTSTVIADGMDISVYNGDIKVAKFHISSTPGYSYVGLFVPGGGTLANVQKIKLEESFISTLQYDTDPSPIEIASARNYPNGEMDQLIKSRSGKNLLINSWFISPYLLNTQGLSTYTPAWGKYSIDGWLVEADSDLQITIGATAITITNTGTLLRQFEQILPNNTLINGYFYTVSAYIFAVSGTVNLTVSGTDSPWPGYLNAVCATGYISASGELYTNGYTGKYKASLTVAAGASIIISKIKLESGSISTLPYDTSPSALEIAAARTLQDGNIDQLISSRIPENLLWNSCFVPPYLLNTSGLTAYNTYNAFTVDLWRLEMSEDGYIQITSNGIVFNQTSGFTLLGQILDNPSQYVNKTLTLSAYIDGILYSHAFSLPGTTIYSYQVSTDWDFSISTETGRVGLMYLGTSNSTVSRVKLEYGYISTLPHDNMPTPLEIAAMRSYSNGNIDQIIKNRSSKNILINSWFISPYLVNQKGQSSYTGSVYGIDMWKIGSATGALTLSNGAISSITDTDSGKYMFEQFIEDYTQYAGKTLTLSFDFESASNISIRISDGVSSRTQEVTAPGITKLTYTTKANSTSLTVIIISTDVNASCKPLRAKLEEGSISTLAYDTLPTPAEQELNRQACMRYYQKSTGSWTVPANTTIMVPIHTMRIAPSVTITNVSGGSVTADYINSGSFRAVNGLSVAHDFTWEATTVL